MSRLIAFGDLGLHIQPNAAVETRPDGITVSVTITGLYQTCVAQKPLLGNTIPGFPGTVSAVRVERGEGALGKIVVTLAAATTKTDAGAKPPDDAPEYSVSMVSETKPLEAHPMFADKDKWGASFTDIVTYKKSIADAGGKTAAWERIFGDVSEVKATVSEVIQKIKQASIDDRNLILADEAQLLAAASLVLKFFEKWDAGIESYLYSSPVLRKTTTGFIEPKLDKVNYIESSIPSGFKDLSPKQSNGSDFSYLKTGDEVDRSGPKGKLRRVEEWKGAAKWDEEIYK
ncbi:MAG: hypothetical protein LBC18_13655 [Opitutaceae bacterium]|jgi:hypothetical protein|nr:hypothetical protein [Opitutaceae bacterium]